MCEFIGFFATPLVALATTQVIGLIIVLRGLNSNEQIAALSSTCWDYNPDMIKYLASNSYDQKIGLFTVTLPTILQAPSDVPFWSSYVCLLIGLFLRFSPIRTYFISKRTKKIIEILNNKAATT